MARSKPPRLDPATERSLAAGLFNRSWELLERDERTPEEDDELVHAAHASAHHWRAVGGPVNRVRSEWQCSRVYATLGRPEPALHHARRCLELCEEHGIAGFDLAYAYEALARAHALAGDPGEAERWRERAREAAAGIAEQDDRELLLGDLETFQESRGRPADHP